MDHSDPSGQRHHRDLAAVREETPSRAFAVRNRRPCGRNADKDHRAGPFADLGREPVDAFDDAGQIVLGLPIEESDLHIDDKHCVHEWAGKSAER